MSEITTGIANFARAVTSDALPLEVRQGAIQALDTVLSQALSAIGEPLVSSIGRTLSRFGSSSELPSIGTDLPLSFAYAAMTLGTAASLGMSSDSLLVARLSTAVVPACFIAARIGTCADEDLLVSIAVGLEIASRSADALGPRHVERGWDVVGSAGRLGATVGAALALGLTAAEIADALGFACTTSAGLSVGGKQLAALSAGKTAADSVEAALLAKNGLIGPPSPIEGRRGLFALVAREGDPAQILHGLGESWQFSMTGETMLFASAIESSRSGARSIATVFDSAVANAQ